MTTEYAQDLTEKINQSITTLCAETDAAKQSAKFKEWLKALGRFHRYSFTNCMLIAMQKPVT